jgi:hypothetical protein
MMVSSKRTVSRRQERIRLVVYSSGEGKRRRTGLAASSRGGHDEILVRLESLSSRTNRSKIRYELGHPHTNRSYGFEASRLDSVEDAESVERRASALWSIEKVRSGEGDVSRRT